MKVHEQSGNDFASHLQETRGQTARSLNRRHLLAAAAALVLFPASALSAMADTAGKEHTLGPWQSPLLRDHPLVGRIIDARTGRSLALKDVIAQAAAADVLVIGETHDNPDHHRLQGRLLAAFAATKRKRSGRPPAIVFEMIDTDRDAALARVNGKTDRTADDIFDAAEWDTSGWPARAIYRPVMQAAARSGGPVVAAGLPRQTVRTVGRQGLKALPPARRQALRLAPLPPAHQESLERQIVKSHCDMIPRQAAAAMSGVQRLRDALLAERVMQALKENGSVVLITGTGHARADRGAPLYIRRHDPQVKTFVVWLAEAREEARDWRDLLPEDARPAELADVVVVTPRAERKDPCEEFRKFMERKKRHEGKGGMAGDRMNRMK